MHTLHPIRVSTKAIIIQDGRLLCNAHADEFGDWYSLPGGGQEYGETLHDALKRECLEEINATVDIGNLRFVRDYIADHHEFAGIDGHTHQIELMFECSIVGAYEPQVGSHPDSRQSGTLWIRVEDLDQHRLYPKALIPHIMANTEGVVYLGDVN